jgi:hypothetical protein
MSACARQTFPFRNVTRYRAGIIAMVGPLVGWLPGLMNRNGTPTLAAYVCSGNGGQTHLRRSRSLASLPGPASRIILATPPPQS